MARISARINRSTWQLQPYGTILGKGSVWQKNQEHGMRSKGRKEMGRNEI